MPAPEAPSTWWLNPGAAEAVEEDGEDDDDADDDLLPVDVDAQQDQAVAQHPIGSLVVI